MSWNSYDIYDCNKVEGNFECTNKCTSIWFRVWDAELANPSLDNCDSVFYEKYHDIS